ncbi:uncharacterized protein LOC133867456 [Alnus glutinosa]|uniref:uncharacterized protein LOC133867456 n=1 Tax=Alnus glutinosa TaxID=3517 RepID=UPI002D77E11D|nr:uncharacterized protein LOC133867456 [Alnus glutinosa]
MNKSKETEEVNEQGEIETKVETVDYRSPAGRDEEEPTKEKVEVIHLTRDEGHSSVNEQGEIETKVETVDYRSPAGRDEEPPTKAKVAVVHLTRDKGHSSVGGGGVLAGPAAAVANTVRSAKDAVLGSGKDDPSPKK